MVRRDFETFDKMFNGIFNLEDELLSSMPLQKLQDIMADGQHHCVVSHFAKLVGMQGSHSNTRFLWRHHARVKSWRNPKEFSLG
jgi:hypothetical protein